MLPGFRPALGYTIFYLSLIVLIPLSALVFRVGGAFPGTTLSPQLRRHGY